MVTVFGHDGLYWRHLHLLPTLVIATDRDIRWNILSAMSTYLRPVIYHLSGREKLLSMSLVPRLLARSSPAGHLRCVLHRGRIARGWFGRVGGIQFQTPSHLNKLFLECVILHSEPLHQIRELLVVLPPNEDKFSLNGGWR
jgi:hypothetical protein